MKNLTTIAAVVAVALFSSFIPTASGLFPEVEITLANDGSYPIWYMCQTGGRRDSLYALQPNSTFRFVFRQIAFPMRWCYLYYATPNSNGFFWAYTVRSRCTKCFWSINKYPRCTVVIKADGNVKSSLCHLILNDRIFWSMIKRDSSDTKT
ncbi:hypothetical protein BUALT_Bualt15G0037500 [Buddleja alternifolia]|uniref:S-protein homolog n=1 Tax=Buddleja alternifolia TaxID=168488 RepID=A0AAV6WD06_9LAMI|nr:hypothetical protein BUALT_Bualt15G0037500 [Buddleja alternifolia]